jgi:predicted secreted protein
VEKKINALAAVLALLASGSLVAYCTKCAQEFSQPITVATGKTYTLNLTTNPSTGYHWVITNEDKLAPFVSVAMGAVEYASTSKPGLAGAPGELPITITGLKPGVATLTLEYRGPGKNATVAEQKMFTITVKEGIKQLGKIETIILGGGTKKNPGKTTYTIELTTNPSTGSLWTIAEQDLPKGTTVTFGDIKYAKTRMMGAPGILPVEIKSGEAGMGKLRLDYISHDKKVIDTKEYKIIVKPGTVK